MYDFKYHRPASAAEAATAMQGADDGIFMAGGQTMLPTMKHHLAAPSDVVDLGGIAELTGISASGGTVTIGAMTTHAAVADSSDVRGAIAALADLAENIGDAQVRNRGTIGGSIANNDPAADYPAACVALGATINTNQGSHAAGDFFTGLFETALAPGEIITSISFPAAQCAAYAKFPNPASRYALVGVFVAKTGDGVRVAVTGAGPGVFRVSEYEAALDANFSAGALDGVSLTTRDLNSDIHAGADYRAHLIGVMTGRAVAACA